MPEIGMSGLYEIHATREPPLEFRGNPLNRNNCQEFNGAAPESYGITIGLPELRIAAFRSMQAAA
jgi:hypothetical protein